MRWLRSALVVLVCSASDCQDSAGPPVTRHLALFAGAGQTDTVGQTLPLPYEVQVTDGNGQPLAAIPVSWTVTSGGGAFTATETSTDAQGRARATHRLGFATGLQSARAQVSGAVESPITFTTTAVAGAPFVAGISSGDRQGGSSGAPLTTPYAVRVTDQYGNPTAAVTVEFTAHGGSVSAPSALTGFNGIASVTHTLGAGTGPDSVFAVVPAITDTLVFVSYAIATIPVLKEIAVPGPTNYGLHDTFVRDGLAFACVWDMGIFMYDVGNGVSGGTPANPVIIDTIPTVSGNWHNAWWFHNPVTMEQRYLFVGEEGPGIVGSSSSGDIHVIDVSDLHNPQEVAFYHMNGAGAHNFWMDEAAQVLYAAFYNGGVVALDVSGTLSGNLASKEIARIQPGGANNTYVWGVQQHNGSIYAVDMLSGVWQLRRTGSTFTVAGGGNNVLDRYGSDLWAHGEYLYSGTWGLRSNNPGNTVKIWLLGATGAPSLVNSINIGNASTISDLQVSADGQVLVFSSEGGLAAGLHVYGLIDPQNPVPLARINGMNLHTATVSDIGGRRYVFAAKNPGSGAPSLIIFDITDYVP